MASERTGESVCEFAHASTFAMNSSESLIVRAGSAPVGFRPAPGLGPPLDLRIAFFIIQYYAFQA
jgi:hypothetical protein